MRWLFNRRLAVWYHPSFRLPFSGATLGTGIDARRADNVLTWLLDERLVKQRDVFEAPEVPYVHLRRVHDDAWLETLDDPEVIAGVIGVSGPVPVASMIELWRRGVGACVQATRWVAKENGVAATLMGGFHHAAPDRGAGFCALNDIAVAISVRRVEGLEGRVLVLDLDAHPPDGLGAFDLPGVEIRSVSGDSEWTAENVLDVRVPLGSTDEAYLAAVDEALAFDPTDISLAIYLAGSDPAVGDALGGLAVTPEGLRERDRRVFDALDDIPTVVVPGGGYSSRAWTYLAGSIAQAVGSRKVVAPDYDPVARKVGRVARTLATFDDHLEITEADLGMAFGGPDAGERRFLDHYTRHGIEYSLSRYGVFDALERMGFTDLELEVQTTRLPHRLRIHGTYDGKRSKLVEVVLTFRNVETWRTLFVEWLELVDPRIPLGSRRPPLPGQASPGLGMAREVASILDVVVARLHLDGLSFVPSHYHVAWIARKHAQFVDPEVRGRFRAFRKYFKDVPLSRASAGVHAGLPTEEGEELAWKPSLMVRAQNESLFAWLKSTDEQAGAFERGTLFRLLPVDVALSGVPKR